MTRNNTRTSVETGILTGLLVILGAFIGYGIPLLNVFASLTGPVVMAVIGFRHGLKWSFLSAVITIVLLMLTIGPAEAVFHGFTFASVGIPLGETFRRRWSVVKILTIPSIVYALTICILVIGVSKILGYNMYEIWLSAQEKALDMIQNYYAMAGASTEQVQMMVHNGELALSILKKGIIAILVITSFVQTFITASIMEFVCRRLGTPVVKIPPVSKWRMPEWSVHVYLLSVILMFGAKEIPFLESLGYNLAWLGGIMLLIQGLACMWTILSEYTENRILKSIAMLILYSVSQITVVIGMLDLAWNIRKYWVKKDI